MTQRHFFTAAEKAEMWRRRRRGEEYAKIADAIGRSTSSVGTWFRMNGQPSLLSRTEILAKEAAAAMARKQGFVPELQREG
jgi:hypothetical protein